MSSDDEDEQGMEHSGCNDSKKVSDEMYSMVWFGYGALLIKSIRFSAFRACFHAYIYPCAAAWACFFNEGSAIYTKNGISNFFSTFWTFWHLGAPL